MPWLPAATSSCTTSYTILQFTAKNMAAELLKTSIETVANVSEGLPSLLGDLRQCVAFKEVQTERLPLILRQTVQHFPKPGSPNPSFERLLIFSGSRACANQVFPVSIYVQRTSIAHSYLNSTLQSLIVNRLHDPRASRAFGGVIDAAFPIYVKEDVLNKVVCFGGVAKDSPTDPVRDLGIATEKASQGIAVIQTDAFQ
jgi:hypothetical protein